MLMSVALASGAMLFWPVLKGATGGSLTAAGAVQLINREKAVVIDVCEVNEFAAAHIVGAKNIPLGQLEEKLPTVVKNKALPVILVCQSGARSSRAVAIAKKLGYEQAQSLGGGLKAWKEPTCRLKKPETLTDRPDARSKEGNPCKPSRCTPPPSALTAFAPSRFSRPKALSRLKKSASIPIRRSVENDGDDRPAHRAADFHWPDPCGRL